MKQINVKIEDELLKQFRDVVYRTKGLKKGDFKDSIEEAMIDYTEKYSKKDI